MDNWLFQKRKCERKIYSVVNYPLDSFWELFVSHLLVSFQEKRWEWESQCIQKGMNLPKLFSLGFSVDGNSECLRPQQQLSQ